MMSDVFEKRLRRAEFLEADEDLDDVRRVRTEDFDHGCGFPALLSVIHRVMTSRIWP